MAMIDWIVLYDNPHNGFSKRGEEEPDEGIQAVEAKRRNEEGQEVKEDSQIGGSGDNRRERREKGGEEEAEKAREE